VIAVDANVLLRLFVNDDAAQGEKARALFEAQADEDGLLWIADVVLAELVSERAHPAASAG
jgi:predicted nucleic-acid-binding protein